MESDWIEYKCKSDQPIFLCNKVTGVHKWPPGFDDVSHSILFVDIGYSIVIILKYNLKCLYVHFKNAFHLSLLKKFFV